MESRARAVLITAEEPPELGGYLLSGVRAN